MIKAVVLIFSLLLVGVDQLLKLLAINNLKENSIPLIEDFLHLTYVENTGAAFGIFQNMRWVLITVTIIVLLIAIALILFNKVKNKMLMWTLALIIGGGAGNLIDRIFRGFVVDYIDLRVINFAVFNFADCCVVVGTILLMIYILFFSDDKDKAKPAVVGEKKHYKLELTLEDHSNDKSNKINKYINVVGEVMTDDVIIHVATDEPEQDITLETVEDANFNITDETLNMDVEESNQPQKKEKINE